ncbi:MAG: tetratricopeptide repeat protein [Ardenticatenaceae bacterium]|nr:tetratricopeptide repeat protein [Ardenticatenaceae bacterium]
MVIKDTRPRYPRRGPSCMLVLFVILGVVLSVFVMINRDDVRAVIIPTAIPTPTRSATEYALLADLSEQDGEYTDAIDYYKTAIRLDATRPEFYIRLINLLVARNRAEEAIEAAEQVTILAPDNDRVWTAVASAYLANGTRLEDIGDPAGASLQYAQAWQAAREAININAENATAYAYAAGGLVLQGSPDKYAQAQELADFAIYLEPNNPWARYYMATVFVYLGEYTQAITQLQLGIEADPTIPDLYYSLAYNYYADSNVPLAIVTLEDALAIAPDYAPAYDGLAHMYLQLGEDALAEENAIKSVELNPNVARAQGRLGEAYFRRSNFPKAVEHLELAVQMYGEPTALNARFFNMLASSYYRTDTNLCDKATPLFQQVIEVSPVESPTAVQAVEGLELCRLASLGTTP